MSLGDVMWGILFNEDLEKIPDPNKPENTAFLSATKKAEIERMRAFAEGPGKVLFDRWKKQIRTDTISLLMSEPKCDCAKCWEIKKIRNILQLVLEAEQILTERKN